MSAKTACCHGLLALAALLPCACGSGSGATDGSTDAAPAPTLKLLRERKLSKILSADATHFEASGVTLKDGALAVVFDNMTSVASVAVDLSTATLGSGLIQASSYEAITFDPLVPRFYVMQETVGSIPPSGQIVSLDADGVYQAVESTDVTFLDANKGFEGLAWLTVNGEERLLALCEGNFCTSDTTDTGHGKLVVLVRQGTSWVTETTIDLPPEASFADYSDVALQDGGGGTYRIAVVSQESSALWLGTLTTEPWGIVGAGQVYQFPRNVTGAVQYCTVEGVTFLSAGELAFVSDKSDGTVPCNNKDESVHVFAMP